MKTAARNLLTLITPIFLTFSLSGQIVITDTMGFFWTEESVDTAFGAWETNTFIDSGGNPGSYRFMSHHLPYPPGPEDLAYVAVGHIYNFSDYNPSFLGPVASLDFTQDLRLLNLPWDQAFMRSYPLIKQNGRLFRADQYIEVVGHTSWTTGTAAGLTAEDFEALDGSMDHPDFSSNGAYLEFGYWRSSSRSQTLPPYPPGEVLVYEHGLDNFTVTIYQGQRPPIARHDDYLYLNYFDNDPISLPVLDNDIDPDGDTIYIVEVTEPLLGIIPSYTQTQINYFFDSPIQSDEYTDLFQYTASDGELTSLQALVIIHFCVCPLECISSFLSIPDSAISPMPIQPSPKVTRAGSDTLDLDLFRRFRDEILQPTEAGTALIDFYYHSAKEVMPLLLITNRKLGRQAKNALLIMQDPIRNLLDGDGSALITQELVDSVNIFIDSLRFYMDDSLLIAFDSALAVFCPFQELVGLTVAEATTGVICDTMNTSIDDAIQVPGSNILNQNFPNPFHSDQGSENTEITYTLAHATPVRLLIYNIRGRKIKTLVDDFQINGPHSIAWDGTDDHGTLVPAGLYFYQIQVNGVRQTKGMILIR